MMQNGHKSVREPGLQEVTNLEGEIKTKGKYHFPMGVRKRQRLTQSG